MNTKFKALASALLLVFVSGGVSAFKPNKDEFGHQFVLKTLLTTGYHSPFKNDTIIIPRYGVNGIPFADEAIEQIVLGGNSRDWPLANNNSEVDCYVDGSFPNSNLSNICSIGNDLYVSGDIYKLDAHFDDDGLESSVDAVYQLIAGKPVWENQATALFYPDVRITHAGISVLNLLKKYVNEVSPNGIPTDTQRKIITIARIKLGKALHTVHDFYAHSTWADFHKYNELFLPITDNLIAPKTPPVFPSEYKLAHPTKGGTEGNWQGNVCTPAPGGGNWDVIEVHPDAPNGVVSSGAFGWVESLTTGAALDTDGAARCDHGTGGTSNGIAKDEPNWPVKPGFSDSVNPPGFLHLKASEQAARHSVLLLDKLVQIIRTDSSITQTDADRMIAALLGVDEPPPRIALVVDTSGSMGTIVQGISAAIGDLSVPVNGLTVHTYYADSVYATANSDREKIQSLLAMGGKGGAGCQPMAMAVLESVIKSLPKKSAIYFFTDASSSDIDKLKSVSAAANERDVKINQVVMGACGKDGDQSEAELNVLANYTRGRVSHVLPDRVPVREAVKSLLRTESVLNQARSLRDLSGVSSRAAVDTTVIYTPGSPVLTEIGMVDTTQTVDIAVDGGVAQVLLTLAAPGAQASLVDAAGQAVALADSGSGLLFAAVNNPTAGTWRLVMTAPSPTPYQVQVEAQGGVALKNLDYAALIEVGPRSGHEYAPPLGSRPPSGASKASLTIEGVAGDALSLHYVNQNGSLISSYPMARASAVAFNGKVTVPASAYWVKVSGQSERGGSFVRMWRGEHSLPSPMPGGRIVVDALERTALTAGSAAKLAVRFSNVGADENLTLTARSSLGAVTVTPGTLVLPANTASRVDLGFFVPAGATAGDLVLTLTSSTGARDVPLLISILTAAIKPVCTVSAAPISIAAGASSTLTAACTGGPTSYAWTGATGCASTASTCTVSPSVTTTYSVAATNASGTGTAASTTVSVALTSIAIPEVINASSGGNVVSSPITVTGLTGTAPISITNGEYQLNGGAWTSLAGTVKNGDVVNVRVTAATQPNTTMRSTLTIGSTSGSFAVTTAAAVGMPDDGTVTDPNTGLVWMRCAQGQTWSTGTCMGTASNYTFDESNALTNTVTFAGMGDWRLPNIRELLTIVDYTAAYPAADTTVFPNFSGMFFWSGSPHASNSSLAWRVYFNFGYGNQGNRGERGAVRLVRGGQSFALLNTASPTTDYVDGGDGTVTHEPTGLVWQRCLEGQVWSAGSCTATARSLTWNAASVATSIFAGNTDWRTPTIAELLSLVDYTKPSPGPTMNSAMFPSGAGLDLWTSTPVARDSNLAWSVYFGYGGGAHDSRSSSYPVRLVRRVQSLAPLPPTDINCVLNWAETLVPDMLTPPNGATKTADTISYRAYSNGLYVGVEGGSNTVLAVGGLLGANVLTVGQLGDFLPTARAAACK